MLAKMAINNKSILFMVIAVCIGVCTAATFSSTRSRAAVKQAPADYGTTKLNYFYTRHIIIVHTFRYTRT